MSATLTRRLEAQFAMYEDLAATLPAETLASHLGELRSNTIGEQLWCVIGGRESWARAIPAGEWQGFACSLNEAHDPPKVNAALAASADAVRAVLGDELAPASEDQALGLLEHEAGHAGQLLRYVLGLELEVPESWQTYFGV
jgi:hypothetical protein